MNRIKFGAIAGALIFGAATMNFAQATSTKSTKPDSLYRVNVRDLAELEVVTEIEYRSVGYTPDTELIVFRADTAETVSIKTDLTCPKSNE